MNGNLLVCFVGGLGIGMVIGMLVAPQSGRDTRDAIREKAAEGRDRMIHEAEEFRDQAAAWLERGKEAVQRQKEGIVAGFEEGKKAYQSVAMAG